MEKNQFDLCIEVLRRLDQAEVLLQTLIQDHQQEAIKEAFQDMPRRWQTKVRQQLTDPLDETILKLISAK